MALTQYYVDPTNGSDSTGTGAIGAPWKSTQHALNTIVQGVGGDQVNIRNTSDDVLSAILSLATYGTPTGAKPLILSGYATSANDGGIGGISGNSGGFLILSSAAAGIVAKDMRLHHCGAAGIWSATGTACKCINCEFDHSTSGTAVSAINLVNCYLHDLSGSVGYNGTNATYCNFDGTATAPSTDMCRASGTAMECVVRLVAGSACNGIRTSGTAERNSVYGGGTGTGSGIYDNAGTLIELIDNIVEGFNGTGGKGYNMTGILGLRAGNRAFGNATNYSGFAVVVNDLGTDTTTGSSSFNNASGGDLTLAVGCDSRSTSSTPACYPGTYKGSTYKSYRDKGAFQSQPSSGGGTTLVMVEDDV